MRDILRAGVHVLALPGLVHAIRNREPPAHTHGVRQQLKSLEHPYFRSKLNNRDIFQDGAL